MSALGPTLLAVGAFLVLAYAVQTVTGFGSQVIALSLSALVCPLGEVMPVILALNLPVCLWVIAHHRRRVDGRLLARTVLPWMGAGAAVGIGLTWRFGIAPPRWPFGLLVVAFAAVEIARLLRGRPARVPTAGAARAWLLAGGLVHGVYASGGPLVVAGLARAPLERDALRATLMTLWLALNGLVLASLVARGAWTGATTLRALALSPTVPAGLLLGGWLRARVDERGFRAAVQVTLLVAGVALVA